MNRLWLAAILLLPAWAGCVAQGDGLPLMPLTRPENTLVTWTWPDPLAYDGTGNRTEVPWGDLPVGVERLLDGGGAEPNVGITSSGAIFVTVGDAVQRSMDHGRTWSVVKEFIPPVYPLVEDRFRTADPMLWVDVDTDRVFVSHMHPSLTCTYLGWSDDDGSTWVDRYLFCGIPGVDHQKIMTAPPGPKAPVPMVAYPNLLYLCVNKRFDPTRLTPGMGTSCAVSYDGGLTVAYETEAYINDPACSNINGHPAAYPDGTVVVGLGNLGRRCERPLTVVLTEDNGLTWQTRQCLPEVGQVEIDPDITVTPDGTAYMLYRDTDQLVHLLRTTDKFQTCETFRISPADHTLGAFTVITSGDDGRIAMAYLGTRDPQKDGAEPEKATLGTVWHLFVTTSLNAHEENPIFVTQQVTPHEDPVQVGCIWYSGGDGGPHRCRNLLDFIDMHRDLDGRWYVAVADGCVPRNGCSGDVASESDFQSRDRQVAVVVQDRGVSLLASKGVLPSLGLERPQPHPR